MMPGLLGRIAAATIAFSFAGAAHAAKIYDNGPPQGGGLEVTQSLTAEDFHFASDTTVGGAGVYLDGNVLGGWDGFFQYSIYAVAGGAPGALLTSGAVTITPVDAGDDGFGGRLFLFQFDLLTPFEAAAGQSYYLGVHARKDFGDNNGIFWAGTDDNGTLTSQFLSNGSGPFIPINQEHAFFLTSAGVPEPTTWALALLGFGTLGAALRRRPVTIRTA